MNKLLYPQNRLKLTLALIFVIGNGLLLAPAGSLPKAIGAIVVLLLPGVVVAEALGLDRDRLLCWGMGAGIGYVLMVLVGLLLHYWPGPVTLWMVIFSFNFITLLGLGWLVVRPSRTGLFTIPGRALAYLLLILLIGAIFRFIHLGYSEFDGDEIKAMVPAAEAIEGQPEALFDQRKKGPGEILAPMLVWRLTDLITEQTARLPFAIAGMLVILLSYLLGRAWFGEVVGLLAALLLALNGLLVAFSRIVQYQQLVLLTSLLAMLAIWRWRSDGRWWWWPLCGLIIGVGLLFHYDAMLVLPALAYAVVAGGKTGLPKWSNAAAGGGVFLAVVGLFGLPYWQAASTINAGSYLAERIGTDLLKNRLDDFLHINSFYSSFYYIILISLLALYFLGVALARLPGLGRWPGSRYWLPVAVMAGSLIVVVGPGHPVLALAWFLAIFLGALFATGLTVAERVAIIWLASAFIGYTFFVATPRTHFYTVLPPMVFLAAVPAPWLWQRLRLDERWALLGGVAMVLLFGSYLFHVYLRPAVQYETDWPDSRIAFFWSPFEQAPPYDAYGFIHKSGWKAIGGLYLTKQLHGDYQTNGLTEKAEWYTRHQLMGCYRQSNQFFAVRYRLIDPHDFATYQLAGKVILPWQKGIDIYQLKMVMQPLSSIDVAGLEQLFDSSATPAAFVRPARPQTTIDVNFTGAIRLRGYQLIQPTAKPGEQLSLILYWQAQQPIPLDADVFVHLEDTPGVTNAIPAIRGQSNGTPGCGRRPTSSWMAGEVIDDLHILTISPDTPPGQYLLKTGLYRPADNLRAQVLDKSGQPVGDAVTLTSLTVE